MRLLVYGGTEHNVRSRIGHWDVVPGVMSDLYGIPESGWIVGFGILPEGCFLFLKTIQHGAGQRPYPYTILVDPEEGTWEKFGWNAAAFAISLLTRNPSLEQLLRNPESFDPKMLDQMIGSLRPIEFKPRHGKLSRLIAGSINLAKAVAVNPKGLNDQHLDLSMEELSAQVEALPPLLRTGKGWLFGGSLENAKYLGAHIVFDENAAMLSQEEIAEIEDDGVCLFENLKEFAQVPEAAQALDQFQTIPTWKWKAEFGIEPSEFIRRMDILCRLKTSEILDEQLDIQEKETKIEGVLGKEIRDAFLERIVYSKENFSAKRTEFVLRKADENEVTSDSLPLDLLDPAVYNQWLIRCGKLPSEFGFSVRLSIHDIRRNCRERLAVVLNPSMVPGVLKKIIDELENAGGQEFCDEFAREAFNKTKGDWQGIWIPYREEAFFVKYLADLLSVRARENVGSERENWEAGYLYYADDAGGFWLASLANKLKVSEFLDWLLRHYKQDDDSTIMPTKWLAAAAKSPLRDKLSNSEKAEIARINGNVANAWRSYLILMALLEGKHPKHAAPSDEEMYLRNELQEFFSCNPDFEETPKIEGSLERFFGKLPIEYTEYLNVDKQSEAIQKKKDSNEKTSAVKTIEESLQPLKPDFNTWKNTAAALVSGQQELSQNVYQALEDTSLRVAFVAEFWNPNEFLAREIFPVLHLPLRAEILCMVSKNDPSRFIREIRQLYEVGKFDSFSLSIWECLLLTSKGKDLCQKINMPTAKLAEFIRQGRQDVWDIADLSPSDPLPTAEKEKKEGVFSWWPWK